jgi:hypothetical protein
MFNNNSLLISWQKARSNVFRLQRRILKSVCVGDFIYSLRLQRLLLISNSARLLSIRVVLQGINRKDFFGLENKVSLTFLEKYYLNNLLLRNAKNWIPGKSNEVLLSDGYLGSFLRVQLWSIPDRCWQCLIKLILEPAHESFFSPRNFSFHGLFSLHRMQQVIFLNLSRESYGLQKRILILSLPDVVENCNVVLLLKKILAPRAIKLGIFRFLRLGLRLDFSERLKEFNFIGSFLVNTLLSDIDYFLNSVRVGNNLLFFLKPSDNELVLAKKVFKLLKYVGIDKV